VRIAHHPEKNLNPPNHPAAPHHLPAFITGPGETDILMVIVAVFLVVSVLAVGNLFLRLHTLPERMAHKSQKLQLEIVAVLGLLALFTHIHLFWVIGLILAMIDLPDFGSPLRRIARSTETMAGIESDEDDSAVPMPPHTREVVPPVEESAPTGSKARENRHV
jgi:hypothetical protein